MPALRTAGTLGDRARLSANFRDQYYGLVPAVTEGGDGPAFVTSGLVDPGRCAWGDRPVTFAKRRFRRPTVDLARLSTPMRRWAETLLVPKVVVANQTRVIEAVADPDGSWIPGVPLITVRPTDPVDVPAVAAVLTSPYASAWAWHRAGGTGHVGRLRCASARAGSPSCRGRRAISAVPSRRSPPVMWPAVATPSCRRTGSMRATRSSPGWGSGGEAGCRHETRGSRAALHHRGRRRVRRGRWRTERG